MQVCPQCEQRQHQENAARRPSHILEREPERRREEREGKGLRPHDRSDRVVGEHRQDRDPGNGSRRGAVSFRDQCRSDEPARREECADQHRELDSAEPPEPIER